MQTLNITPKDGYQIIQLDRGKVNAINPLMVAEIRQAFQEAEANDEVKGIILTGKPKVFSAGLDLIELYGFDQEKITAFFSAFGMMHYELSRFSKPFVCAVTGFSPAGGTVIALTADYRVMGNDPKYLIGLNEMQVNIQITTDLVACYAYWLGNSLANRFALDGKLFTPDEAHHYHLVDQICTDEEIMVQATRKMEQYLAADPEIFKTTKQKLRSSWYADQVKESTGDLDTTVRMWWKPEVRAKIKALIESFSKKKLD